MEWSRKEELGGKVGLSKKRGVQWEGKSKGKSKRINRKNRVKMLAERHTRKERSCSYTFMYIYIHTSISVFDTDFLWDLRRGMTLSCAYVEGR